MRRLLIPPVFALSAIVLSSPVWASNPQDRSSLSSSASATHTAVRVAPPIGVARPELQAVVDLVNGERARFGRAPLRPQVLLSQAAQSHSDDMAARQLLTHRGPNGETAGARIEAVGYRFWVWAENVAAGQVGAVQVVRAWMASPGHRANLLSTDVSEIGVGLAMSATRRPYWTVTLAQPAG